MSNLAPRRLRRIALISLISGVALLVVVEVISIAMSGVVFTNDDLGVAFLAVLLKWLGCSSLVFAGNALAWSFIVPRLPQPSRKRGLIVGGTTLGFVIVSVVAVFFMLLYLPDA